MLRANDRHAGPEKVRLLHIANDLRRSEIGERSVNRNGRTGNRKDVLDQRRSPPRRGM